MKHLRIHEAARREANEAAAWYADRSVVSAKSLSEKLLTAISQAQHQPERYPLYLHGTRPVLVSRFPYFVVYLNWQEEIYIVAIIHAKRRPGYWKNRV